MSIAKPSTPLTTILNIMTHGTIDEAFTTTSKGALLHQRLVCH